MTFDRTEYLSRAARMPRAVAPEKLQQLSLPSGANVTVAKPGVETWLAANRLPQSITIESFHHFLQGKLKPGQISDDHIQAVAELQRAIIEAALIEPRIVPDKADLQPGELYYRDLTPEDAVAIFQFALRREEVADLAAFREEGRVPAAGADGGAVRPAAKRARRRPRADGGPGAGA